MPRLVALVSPHGFGHAARVSAVLEAFASAAPSVALEIWSAVPEWFFAESLPSVCFRYRAFRHDVGLVQSGALADELPATVAALEELWRDDAAARLARELARARADLALCDISPLGLAAARRARIPAVLLENFTWDWIYEGYADAEPRLRPWVERLGPIFAGADLRLRATPACPTSDSGVRNGPPRPSNERSIGPIARRPRASRGEARARLGIGLERAMVLVSLGGIRTAFESLDLWRARDDIDFVVPGGAEREERRGNLLLLPHHSPVYHPDLVRAADVVVGKLGYSTVAEAFAAGARFAWLPRPAFRESAVLERFVRDHLPAARVDPGDFADGTWTACLDELLSQPKPFPRPALGAAEAAAAILGKW